MPSWCVTSQLAQVSLLPLEAQRDREQVLARGRCSSITWKQRRVWFAVNLWVVGSWWHVGCWVPLVLWCCWLGDRKGIRPVKTEWWGTGVVICLEQDANLREAQLMPLPLTVSCFSKIQIGFTFLVPAHPGSPGQRAFKRVCVCVCVLWVVGK